MMKPYRMLAVALATIFLTGMVHNHLVKSIPGSGETLTASPREVRLWFNERPEVPFTSVTILTSDSTKVATIKAVPTPDSMSVALPLPTTLAPGRYLVNWRTASTDGHAVRGTFGFSITP
jgi:copper resistance protein C